MNAKVDPRASSMSLPIAAVALTVIAACHAPLADRRIARSWQAGLLKGKVIVLAPLEHGTPSFGGGVDPGPDLVRAAQRGLDAADAEFSIATDYYQRQLRVAQRMASASELRFQIPSLTIAAYHALTRSTNAWLNVTVEEKTFQVPKRQALGSLAADLALVVRNRFEREDFFAAEHKAGLANTLCISDFLVWDYDSERVVAEGRVEARVIQAERWIELYAWQQLATETMDQILRARPFVDD